MADLKMTPEMKYAIVELLGEIPNITVVAKTMGMSPTTIRNHMKSDEDFDNQVRDAMECGYDLMEEEARRRAVDGVEKPVYYKGKKVEGGVREYSDQLLMFILKAYRPKRFNPGQKLGFDLDDQEKITVTFNIGETGED